jgi:DUF4097 and DUF4098 domain-containing protein YvlB
MRMATLFAACALVGTVSTASAATTEVKQDFDETFPVTEGSLLRLDHGDGAVTIVPWEKDEVRVVVHYDGTVMAGGLMRRSDFDVEFRQSGKTLHVIGHEPGASGVGWVRRTIRKYVYEISAPAYMRLELIGDDGDVSISGWREDVECVADDGDVILSDVVCGRVRVTMEDGDAQLEGITADLNVSGDDGRVTLERWQGSLARIAVADGDVFIADASGDLHVSLDDGDLDIRRLTTESLTVTGEDGDIVAGLAAGGPVDINITTDDGDVDLRLAPETSAMLSVAMDDGDVSVSYPGLTGFEKSSHSITGQIGAGVGSIRVRTADGDVRITAAK